MEENPVHDISQAAALIMVHLPEPLQEKFNQPDIELILKNEGEYILELLVTLDTPGPIDILINPRHQVASIVHACMLKGLPLEEDEIAKVLEVKQTYVEGDGESTGKYKHDINYN